jgi:hypothetical protein
MGRPSWINRAIYLIPFFSAPISLFSSSYVVYRILKIGRQNRRPRDQLLLGLSFLDMCSSFGFSFSTMPAPAGAMGDGIYPSYGTVGTCTAQGFFVQLGLGVSYYNASLCIYYLLTVRHRISKEYVSKWLLPMMHLVTLTITFGLAIAALRLKLFNHAGAMGCWIHPAYTICKADPQYCDRGLRADEFEIYFGLIHVALCFVFVVVSMILLFFSVRKIELSSRRWAFGHSESSRTSMRESMPLARRTAETGMLYSASFIIVYLPTALSSTLRFGPEGQNSPVYISLLLLSVALLPLQGFFNMLIYTSPEWLKWLHERKVHCSCLQLKQRSSQRENERLTGIEVEDSDSSKENVFERGSQVEESEC